MLEELEEKYGDMTEEEFEALPEEEKAKIKAAMEADAEELAKGLKKEVDKLSDEEKAKIKDSIKQAQEYGERTANYTEAEVLAEMMNPETEGFTEEELKEAKRMMADPNYNAEEFTIETEAKKGICHAIKAFFRKLFK